MESFNHAGEIALSGNKNEFVALEKGHNFVIQSCPQLKIINIEIRQDADDKTFPCPFCKYRFGQRKRLQQHLHSHRKERPNEVFNLIHVDDNPFKCDKCKSSFLKKQELETHAAQHNPVECEICHKVYATKYILKHHYRVHTEEKPYECEICCKKCASKKDLKQHYFNHANEELSARQNCIEKSSVKHSSSHSDESGSTLECQVINITSELQDKAINSESEHKCDDCSKVFPSKESLSGHQLIHEKYKSYYECDICHKYFIQKKRLERHSRVHSKEKPFECEVCKKRFKTKKYCTSHFFAHTSERLHECDICHKRFARKSDFQQHCRRHTSVKEKPFICEICGEHLDKKNSEIHFLTRHCLTKFSE